MIDTVCRSYHKDQITNLTKDTFYRGLICFGDGATIMNVPLINMLDSGIHNPGCVLEVIDCTGHMAEGGIKMLHKSMKRLFL